MRPENDLKDINLVEPGGQETYPSAFTATVSGGSTKIVVADTSPLNYLIQIECDFLLPLLYQRVITPSIVVAELTHIGAPPIVARWAAKPPVWLEISTLGTRPDDSLCLLDAGERDAIQLAIELQASEILIDESKGRREAQARGFSVVGTLGVLIAGKQADLIDARKAFELLATQTNFRMTPQLRYSFLESLRPPMES